MKLPRKTAPTTKPTNSTQSSIFIRPIRNNKTILTLQIVHQAVALYDLPEITNKILTALIVHQAVVLYDLSEITKQY
jgi:hypothetical protein